MPAAATRQRRGPTGYTSATVAAARPARVIRGAAAAILAAALATSAYAFVCTPGESNVFVSIHWDTREIPVAIRSGASTTIPAETYERIVRESFDAWSSFGCSDVDFDFRPIVADTPAYDDVLGEGLRSTQKSAFDAKVGLDDVSQVVLVHDNWPHQDNILALTTMTFGARDGVIRYGVIEINERKAGGLEGFVFREVTGVESCLQEGDAYDLGAVLTHEVGHFLGLAHTDVVDSRPGERPTMTAVVEPCDPDFRSLSTDDVDGLCYVYPVSLGARQCLPLPDQVGPYIQSTAFGCSGWGPAASGELAVLGAALGLIVRRRTCRAARSGR